MSQKSTAEGNTNVLKCNVCGEPATNRCSTCRIRVYCSKECQRADWRQHKRYCLRPPTRDEQIRDVKEELERHHIPLTYDEFRMKAENPDDPMSVMKVLEDAMIGVVRERSTGGGVDDWPLKDRETWRLDHPETLEELSRAPFFEGDECYIISFATMGDMDKDTGELLYLISVAYGERDGMRATGVVRGRPTSEWDLGHAIYASIMTSLDGSGPHRPMYMMFVHRFPEEVCAKMIPLLQDKLGIYAYRESREAALRSAINNETDPDGYNFPK